MHPHISDLYSLAQKPSRLIIGLMSGTSLDGLDVALCHIKDTGLATQIELLDFETVPYDQYYRDQIRAVFSKRQVDLETVCLLNNWVGEQHAKMIQQCLDQWKRPASSIDLIASHGQTIYHAPQSAHQHPGFSNATLQIGDGDHIAYRTGITTISDFRQKHIAAGGEGAPLAVYGDYLIFSSQQENRILLNLGGIANFTYLPKSMDTTQVLSTDVGTGNTMMDAFVQHHFPGQHYDANAELARRGQVDHDLLAALKAHVFFSQALPKTTGPELFNL
ncbi:MAG: anhydro-N-acetylmuramic acid kinase, partial [Bacteroidota bacterium]